MEWRENRENNTSTKSMLVNHNNLSKIYLCRFSLVHHKNINIIKTNIDFYILPQNGTDFNFIQSDVDHAHASGTDLLSNKTDLHI